MAMADDLWLMNCTAILGYWPSELRRCMAHTVPLTPNAGVRHLGLSSSTTVLSSRRLVGLRREDDNKSGHGTLKGPWGNASRISSIVLARLPPPARSGVLHHPRNYGCRISADKQHRRRMRRTNSCSRLTGSTRTGAQPKVAELEKYLNARAYANVLRAAGALR